jgi:transposase
LPPAAALSDVTSTYFEGRCCPLARIGHSRDGRSDRPQIVFGSLVIAPPELARLPPQEIERLRAE